MGIFRQEKQEEHEGDDEPVVIDLAEVLDDTFAQEVESRAEAMASALDPAKLRHPSAPAAPSPVDTEPGDPGHCPKCDGPGYLDAINLTLEHQEQHCRNCGHVWRIGLDD